MGGSYNNEEPNGSDELITFKRRIFEVIFSKNALASTKTYIRIRIGNPCSECLRHVPQVAMDMAEIAARHVQAALP